MTVPVVLALAGFSPCSFAQGEREGLRTFLQESARLSQREINSMDTGVVVKTLPTTEKKRELAVFGMVRITVPTGLFLSQFRDIKGFMNNHTVRQIGTFSTPPVPGDVAPLRLPESDVRELAKCTIGSCKVKLPAPAFDRLKRIDWSASDAADRMTELFRKGITNYARAYLDGGNTALIVYADKKEPMSLAAGFDALISQTAHFYKVDLKLYDYLKGSPPVTPPGIDSFLYWTVEDFGQRPTTMVTQAVVCVDESGSNNDATIALKQIYASHYFQARLQLMSLVEVRGKSASPATYLLLLDRLRFDEGLNFVKRRIISDSLFSHTEEWLAEIRDRLNDTSRNTTGESINFLTRLR